MTINFNNSIKKNTVQIENCTTIRYTPEPIRSSNSRANEKFLLKNLMKEIPFIPDVSPLNLSGRVSPQSQTPSNNFFIDSSLNITQQDALCTIKLRDQGIDLLIYHTTLSNLAASSDFFKISLSQKSELILELQDLIVPDLDLDRIQITKWVLDFFEGAQIGTIGEYLKELDVSTFTKKIIFYSKLSKYFQNQTIHNECDANYLRHIKSHFDASNLDSFAEIKVEIKRTQPAELPKSLDYLTHVFFEISLKMNGAIAADELASFGKHLLQINSNLAPLISKSAHPTSLLKQIVTNCQNLEQVYLQDIDISLKGVVFGPKIETLNLSNNSLLSNEELESAICNCTKINAIDLSNTKTSLKNIQFGRNLEFLEIENVTTISNETLKTALSQCSNLLWLNLSGTNVSLEGVNLGPKIEHLRLNRNKYITNESLKIAVENWEVIQVLEIDETNISLEGIRLGSNFQWLSASHNNSLIEKVLKECVSDIKSLTYLNLSGTNASLEGIVFGPDLHDLILRELKSITSEQLKHALPNANFIEELDLNGCQVHLDGIQLGNDLHTLKLAGNKKVTEKELVSCITNWKSFKEIDLSSTNISAKTLITESNFRAIELFESSTKLNTELFEQYRNLLKNKNFFLEAIQKCPVLLEKAPSEFRFNPSFIKEVFKTTPAAIEFMEQVFEEDEEIIALDRYRVLPMKNLHKKHLKLAALLCAPHLSVASQFRGYRSHIIYSHIIPLIKETTNSSLRKILPAAEEAYFLNVLWHENKFKTLLGCVRNSLKDVMMGTRSYPCIIPVITSSNRSSANHTFSIIFRKGSQSNTLDTTILNTGDGLNHHEYHGNLLYELSLEFDNIPFDLVETILLTDQLFNYPQTTKHFYSIFSHPLLQTYRSHRKGNKRLSQPGGSCSARAPLETLRYLLIDRAISPEAKTLGLSGYREIKTKLRANWIERIFNNYSLQDPKTLFVGSQIVNKLFKNSPSTPKFIENERTLSSERISKLLSISNSFLSTPQLIKPIKSNQNWYDPIIDSVKQSNLLNLQKKIDSFRHISNSVMNQKSNHILFENFQNQIKTYLLERLYNVEENGLSIPMLTNPDIAYVIKNELLSLPIFSDDTIYKYVYSKLNAALTEVLIHTRHSPPYLKQMWNELSTTIEHLG